MLPTDWRQLTTLGTNYCYFLGGGAGATGSRVGRQRCVGCRSQTATAAGEEVVPRDEEAGGHWLSGGLGRTRPARVSRAGMHDARVGVPHPVLRVPARTPACVGVERAEGGSSGEQHNGLCEILWHCCCRR